MYILYMHPTPRKEAREDKEDDGRKGGRKEGEEGKQWKEGRKR
jgi:hypothetical protein